MTNAFCNAGVLSSCFSPDTTSYDLPLNYEMRTLSTLWKEEAV